MYTPIQQYVLNLLSSRDYSIGQIKRKLVEKGYDTTLIDQDLQLLIQKKWLDDRRVAENILIRYSDSKGKLWVKQKMMQKAIPAEIINETLSDYQSGIDMEHTIANLKRKIATKYSIQDWSFLDNRLKAKVVGYLNRNGFANAFEILKNWQKDK